ncbi:stage V sporulation protein AB [Paenibacillus psychroresistens]|uniref:Stage V sporulation protein AB n=1 Tax=Paenibacillus psychroresistens TaxID=1778678 RepID=A0A6B8RJU9_9BACL|nr:stage V sporulation protein AB [Paenibacillus psychroresistens]QGQ96004.1 stage V sporulation protein AB [Paenibacillus psychroresistens]
MTNLLSDVVFALVEILIGLAGGLAVGGGFVAFLVVLDIIPRLVHLSKSYNSIHLYEGAVVTGVMVWSTLDFFDWQLKLSPISTIYIGLMAGCFVGMLAAALTEVINVLPIMAKRLGMDGYMMWLLSAMILGKVLGSLFEWLVF